MKKIFIAQPTIGLTSAQIKLDRERAIAHCKMIYADEEDEIAELAVGEPKGCLAESILALAQADFAYFVFGWPLDRDCRIANEICKEYGIHRYFQTKADGRVRGLEWTEINKPKDLPPVKGLRVLVSTTAEPHLEIAYLSKNKKQWLRDGHEPFPEKSRITHWMLLPTPPEND